MLVATARKNRFNTAWKSVKSIQVVVKNIMQIPDDKINLIMGIAILVVLSQRELQCDQAFYYTERK